MRGGWPARLTHSRGRLPRSGAERPPHRARTRIRPCWPASATTGLSAVREAIGRQRRGPMLVDDAPGRGLERAGQRRGCFGHVVVDERVELGRFVAQKEGADQNEQLRLAFVEVAKAMEQQVDVMPLPANRRCRRVFARGGEVRAVARAIDLDETLGAAAHRADLVAEGGAATPCAPCATERTDHFAYCIISPKTHRISVGTAIAVARGVCSRQAIRL